MVDEDAPHEAETLALETDFDLLESTLPPQLGIHNDGQINRHLIVHDAVRQTSFRATLDRVQYGTYDGASACLIVVDFSFRFRARALARYSYATINATFTKAVDVNDCRKPSTSPADDPKVINFAPKEVYGIVRTVEQKTVRDVTIPVMFESPIGLSVGVEGHFGMERMEHAEHRMEIHGDLYFDNDHTEGAFGTTWDMSENDVQCDGIFRSFRAAMVLLTPKDEPFWMHMKVEPSVRFSLNPQRLFTNNDPFARLLQKNDEPVLMDGKTSRGKAINPGIDFCSKDFEWNKVVWLPEEYKSQLMHQADGYS